MATKAVAWNIACSEPVKSINRNFITNITLNKNPIELIEMRIIENRINAVLFNRVAVSSVGYKQSHMQIC